MAGKKILVMLNLLNICGGLMYFAHGGGMKMTPPGNTLLSAEESLRYREIVGIEMDIQRQLVIKLR